MQSVRKQPTVLSTTSIRILDGIFAALTCSDANDVFDREQKDLAVADFSCFGGPLNDLYDLGNDFIGYDQFDLGLGDKINLVFRPPVEFGMTLLPSKSPDLADRHPLDTNFCEPIFHFVQLKWFDNGFDLFHPEPPFQIPTQPPF